jgi:hypothetical protein
MLNDKQVINQTNDTEINKKGVPQNLYKWFCGTLFIFRKNNTYQLECSFLSFVLELRLTLIRPYVFFLIHCVIHIANDTTFTNHSESAKKVSIHKNKLLLNQFNVCFATSPITN